MTKTRASIFRFIKSTPFYFLISCFFIINTYAENCGIAPNGLPLGVSRGACCRLDDPNEPCCLFEDNCRVWECTCNTGMPCVSTGEGYQNYYNYCYDSNVPCGWEGQFCCLGVGVDRCADGLDCEFDDSRDDFYCVPSPDCGAEGEPCCTDPADDRCEGSLTCIHNVGDPEYVCGNSSDYLTSCSSGGDVCCYDWGLSGPNPLNLCKTLNILGQPLSPTDWNDCYCNNGLELSFTANSCFCQVDDCGKVEGNSCCLPTDPSQAPYCVNDGIDIRLFCKLGPNTCCRDWDSNLSCDFDCGASGQMCCTRPGPGMGDSYCESSDLQCLNGYCGGRRPFGLLYTGPVIKNLQDILGPVTKMLYYGGLAIGVFFIILSGYRIMTSEGDPQRTKAAQEQLTSAIIGIIFILLSVTILRVIINQIIGENI